MGQFVTFGVVEVVVGLRWDEGLAQLALADIRGGSHARMRRRRVGARARGTGGRGHWGRVIACAQTVPNIRRSLMADHGQVGIALSAICRITVGDAHA